MKQDKSASELKQTVTELACKARHYYDLPIDLRKKDSNFKFDESDLIKQACKQVLTIIDAAGGLLDRKSRDVLMKFIEMKVVNWQSLNGTKGVRADIIPHGHSGPDELSLSLSTDSVSNLLCLSHEIGHAIVGVNQPYEPVKLLWEKNTITNDDEETVWNWYTTHWDECDANGFYIEELLADACSLGVMKSCGWLDYEVIKAIWNETREPPIIGRDFHTIPTKWFKSFLDCHSGEGIDWFKKASDGINLFYSRLGTSFDDFAAEFLPLTPAGK